MNLPRVTKIILIVLFGLLVSCGSNPEPVIPVPDSLNELVSPAGISDIDVALLVQSSQSPATITAQFNPSVGSQKIYEVSGTTPKGKPFKAVLLGDEGIQLSGFKGNMRIKARLVKIQGQWVLVGKLIPKDIPELVNANPIAFIAGSPDVNFTGPTPGTVIELNGPATFQGSCEENGLNGAYGFKGSGAELAGSIVGLRETGKPIPCAGDQDGAMQVALSYTAVQTQMGIIYSSQGSLAGSAAANQSNSSSSRALAPSKGMPATSLAVADKMPTSNNLVTLTTKSNVREIAADSGAELVSFNKTTGELTFNSLKGNLKGLQIGNIIVSAPRDQAPDGLLRKVTAIQKGTPVVVSTSRAVLNDLVDEADITLERSFSDADVKRAKALETGEITYAAAQQQNQTRGILGSVTKEFNLVLYDQDNDDATTDDQIRIRGTFEVKPNLVVKLKCKGFLCSTPDFTAKFVMDEEAKVIISANLKKSLSKSLQLVRIPFGAVAVGPLVFTIELVAEVSLEGEVKVHAEFSATQTMNLEVGVKYTKDAGWTPINTFDKSFSHTAPSFEVGATATGKVTAALRLMLYGVAGVSVDVGAYVRFDAQYPATPAWTLTGGIEGHLNVDLDLIILQEQLSVPIFGGPKNPIEWSIAQAPNLEPIIKNLKPAHQCSDGTVPHSISLNGNQELVYLKAVSDDPEDGKGSGTIEWRSNRDGMLGTTQPGSKHNPGFDLRNGLHTITATISDSKGKSSNQTMSITVKAEPYCALDVPLPTVEFVSTFASLNTRAFAPPIINAAGLVTLHAVTKGGIGGCCTITWNSDLEGELGTTEGERVNRDGTIVEVKRNHTFSAVMRNRVPQEITATITKGGTVSSVSWSVPVESFTQTNPTLDKIEASIPRYVYDGDTVTFTTSSDGSTPVWGSSVRVDNINGMIGSSVTAQFNTTGPRTITVTTENADGGFSEKTYRVTVLSRLAQP
jgi:hypothetical protein